MSPISRNAKSVLTRKYGSNVPSYVVLRFESVDEIPYCDHSMKATEQYFPVVLFIMLYMVVLSFESVDEILKCDHSNERC